jgi:hypothetical protein
MSKPEFQRLPKEKTKDDWERELKEALITGHFPLHCYESSGNFGFCAVGVKLQKENPDMAKSVGDLEGKYLPRRIFTKEAWDLGMKFHGAITNDRVEEASKLFEQIQALPRVLKTEEELRKHDSSIVNRIKDRVL